MAGTWMKFLLRYLSFAAFLLILCSCAFSAPTQNPYDSKLQQLREAWNSADRLQKLVLLDQIFQLRDYVSDPATISALFKELTQANAAEENLIQAEARACLADIAALEGRPATDGARHWYQQEEQRRHTLAEAAADTSNAASLEVLAELEQIAGIPDAADHMQQSAQLAPTAARWRLPTSRTHGRSQEC